MSFSPERKIASSHKKIAVRAMLAHGACSLCIKLCLGPKNVSFENVRWVTHKFTKYVFVCPQVESLS